MSSFNIIDCNNKKNEKCKICLGIGVVPYYKKINGYIYEFYAHCTCNEGMKYNYDGRLCKIRKSNYRYPSIDEIFDPKVINEIKRKNSIEVSKIDYKRIIEKWKME